MTRVAVYGTLKRGFGNHHLIESSEFLGNGKTYHKFRLCIKGLPYLLEHPSDDGKNVLVEVYDVSQGTLNSLDMLEGHPDWYRREPTLIEMEDGSRLNCWVYFSSEEYDTFSYFESYSYTWG